VCPGTKFEAFSVCTGIGEPSVGPRCDPVTAPTHVASAYRNDRSPTSSVLLVPSVTSPKRTALLRKNIPSPSTPGSLMPKLPM
jgi:RES domain-containing protein